MTRSRLIVVVCAAALIALYFGNPLGTASLDPRARLLGFKTYTFPSRSMLPTIQPGDFLVVSTFAYGLRPPSRGDLIAFFPPTGDGKPLVARVVGTGGESISIADAVVVIDGQPTQEPYVDGQSFKAPYAQEMKARVIPEDHVFVLGDNRDNSMDSRIFGPVLRSRVIGKVVMLWALDGA